MPLRKAGIELRGLPLLHEFGTESDISELELIPVKDLRENLVVVALEFVPHTISEDQTMKTQVYHCFLTANKIKLV